MKTASLRTPVGISLLLSAALCVVIVICLVHWRSTPEPLALRFLHYTNNEARVRIAVMEITNHTDVAYRWTLRSDAKPGSLIWITDLVETNGELRGVGI